MNRALRFPKPQADTSLRLALSVAILAWAGSLYAQDALAANGQAAPAAPAAQASLTSTGGSFGGASLWNAGFNSPLFDAFQPAARSSGSSGADGIGLNGSGPFTRSSFNRFGGGSAAGAPGNLASLFQGSSPRSGLPGTRNPGAMAALPQQFDLLGSKPTLRLNSPFGAFRLSYSEMLKQRTSSMGSGFGAGSAATPFTSPGTGNAMFNFSATTMYGGHPMTGSFGPGNHSAGNVPGSNQFGGPKHSGPSVALRLSF